MNNAEDFPFADLPKVAMWLTVLDDAVVVQRTTLEGTGRVRHLLTEVLEQNKYHEAVCACSPGAQKSVKGIEGIGIVLL